MYNVVVANVIITISMLSETHEKPRLCKHCLCTIFSVNEIKNELKFTITNKKYILRGGGGQPNTWNNF